MNKPSDVTVVIVGILIVSMIWNCILLSSLLATQTRLNNLDGETLVKADLDTYIIQLTQSPNAIFYGLIWNYGNETAYDVTVILNFTLNGVTVGNTSLPLDADARTIEGRTSVYFRESVSFTEPFDDWSYTIDWS